MNQDRKHLIDFAQSQLIPAHISIDYEAISNSKLPATNLLLMDCPLPTPTCKDEEVSGVAYLIGLNTLNYMFWSLQSVNAKKEVVRYVFDGQVGANGLRAAFDKAWASGSLTFEGAATSIDFSFVLNHFGDIPDPRSRAALLSEVFSGDSLRLLSKELVGRIKARGSVRVEDASLIQRTFPRAFADPYLKRSQLALMEIASFLSSSQAEVDAQDLTICPDYQLPRVLRALGILKYSEELAWKVDNLSLIDAGSSEERAIRAATVVACEHWADLLGCSCAVIDNYLWLNRNCALQPFHLTFTEAY